MRKTKRIIISILLFMSFLFVGCDLSHKHYTDNYGYCNSCKTDITIDIEKDSNNNYLPKDIMLQHYTDTYLKFVSNGESNITIEVQCESTDIESIILYSKTDDHIASKYDKENPVLTCNEQLTTGETYYIKIKSSTYGSAKIILSNN